MSQPPMTALPLLPDSFYWTAEPWGAAIRCRALDPIAPHVFTTRQLELRRGALPPGAWDALGAPLGVRGEQIIHLRQVHGRDVVVVRPGIEVQAADDLPAADVIVSNDEARAIAVK